MNSLVLYDAMRVAIARCAEVDEAAGIKNKAAQLQAYARVRDDVESQQRFTEIWLRACARIGELSQELETSQGARTELGDIDVAKLKTATLEKAGVNIRTAERYEELAGGKEKHAQEIATEAREHYLAEQREKKEPGTMKGLKGAVVAALGPLRTKPRSKPRSKPQELSPEDRANREWANWMKDVDQLKPELAADGECQEFAQEELDRSERAVAVIRRYQSQMRRKFR